MQIRNGYAEKAKKSQPVKDEDGYMTFTPSQVEFDAQGKFGAPQLIVSGSIPNDAGGEIAQKFYFDFVIGKGKTGWYRLPRTLLALELVDEDKLDDYASREEFTKDDVREIAGDLKQTPFKFRMSKEGGKFRVDYPSICTLDAEVQSFTL